MTLALKSSTSPWTVTVSDLLKSVRDRMAIKDAAKVFLRVSTLRVWGLKHQQILLTVYPTLGYTGSVQFSDFGTVTNFSRLGYKWARDNLDTYFDSAHSDYKVFDLVSSGTGSETLAYVEVGVRVNTTLTQAFTDFGSSVSTDFEVVASPSD